MNLKIKENIKKAFTLSEIIVATFISVIILSFIFIFISDIISWIAITKREVKVMSSFYDFTQKLNNYRNVYSTWWILVNEVSASDVFLMKDYKWENWILFWPINLSDRKLNLDNLSYGNKWLWFRKISTDELAAIDADIDVIYNYLFQSDQIFSDLKIQHMILKSFNSWKIHDLKMILDINYHSSMMWQPRVDVPKDQLRTFNIDF